jgi:phospholipid-binding lipoprotein MlaA
MKIRTTRRSFFFALTSLALLTACSTTSKKTADADAAIVAGEEWELGDEGGGRTVATNAAEVDDLAAADDLDEYDAVVVSDPLEPLNRATFMLNDGIYTVLLRPVSTGYEYAVPEFARTGLTNAFENVKFPVRFVNHTLQGKFGRAGRETGKFLVNSTLGVAGFMRAAERFPAVADLPAADTGQTFAKWGIGHGPYLVLPILGPSSVRDTVGYAGDYALNPVNWVGFIYCGYEFFCPPSWPIVFPAVNTLQALPGSLATLDAATENALDRYIAARTAYIQYRAAVAAK